MSRRDAVAIAPFRATHEDTPEALRHTVEELTRSTSILSKYIVHVIATFTTSITVGDETMLLIDTTLGAITVTLPPAAECEGHEINVKKINAAGANMTIDAHGGEFIDGALTQVTNVQWTNYRMICDGVAWYLA